MWFYEWIWARQHSTSAKQMVFPLLRMNKLHVTWTLFELIIRSKFSVDMDPFSSSSLPIIRAQCTYVIFVCLFVLYLYNHYLIESFIGKYFIHKVLILSSDRIWVQQATLDQSLLGILIRKINTTSPYNSKFIHYSHRLWSTSNLLFCSFIVSVNTGFV